MICLFLWQDRYEKVYIWVDCVGGDGITCIEFARRKRYGLCGASNKELFQDGIRYP